MPEISGYHHLNLTVPNLETSTDWYTSVLGLQKTMELHGEGWRKVLLLQPQSHLVLGLTEHDNGNRDRFDETRTGMDHVAFRAPDRAALDSWKARFEEMGVEHSPIKESAMGWLIVFRDPDNVQLEVYSHGK
jgi:glyoxylase I family protein